MTTPFRDLPIRRKLLVTTLASSAAALAFASLGFVTWDVFQHGRSLGDMLRAQAKLVADASGPALEFKDEKGATEILEPLRRLDRIALACLYLNDGTMLADLDFGTPCPETPPGPGWGLRQIDHLEPVATTGGALVGQLFIRRDLGDVHARLRVALLTAAGLLLLSIAFAFVLSNRLQRVVAAPLLDLANTAQRISETRDYSIRAVPRTNDEIGIVVRSVNHMLDRISERTTELSKANIELEREVAERRRVETERTAALERERDANRLKDEFLATLSHELRTPLNAVLGWARVLRTGRIDAGTQARALESIERNARAQARLIEDLLEVSRIVTGKLRLRVRETDLAAIIDAAVEVVQPAAAAKRIRLSTDLAVRPALTAGDADRLQQVVWNLLSNAVKFTPPGGRVEVSLARDEGYAITVRDTGPGIDPKFLPHVFEPFRQADGSPSREHGGLGLGLAIARRLVELHGGTIHASAPPEGTGAVITVHLPSVVEGPSEPMATSPTLARTPAEPPPDTLLQDVRVLVVDDEEDARMLLATTLAAWGAEVVTASSAAEALKQIDRDAPDVILSDIGMPHEDGYALVRQLRARPASRGGTIPAVAVTAYAAAADRHAAEVAGYQAHVAKPFDPADLARIVARLTRGGVRM